jgi:hypothetical protein
MDHSIAHFPDAHRPALIAEDELPDRHIAVVVHGRQGRLAMFLALALGLAIAKRLRTPGSQVLSE